MLLDRLDVLLVQRPLERGRGPEQRHHPLDQLLLEPGALGGLGAGRPRARGCRAAGPRRSRRRAGRRGPRAAAPRASGRARASARPPGPAPRRRVVQRPPRTGITFASRPALQRRRRDAGDPGGLVERDRVLGHAADPTTDAGRPVCDPDGPVRRRRRGRVGPVALRASRPASPAFGACGASRASPLAPQSPGGSSGAAHYWPVAILMRSETTPAGRAASTGRLGETRQAATSAGNSASTTRR